MKTLSLLTAMMLAIVLAASPAYSAPGGQGKGQGQGVEKSQHARSIERAHKAERASERSTREQTDIRKYAPEKGASRNIDEQGRASTRKSDAALMKEVKERLAKIDNSRWSYNPNDDRGQGNMGNVTMIAPYGHDKDSDRLALYGNRGSRIVAMSFCEPRSWTRVLSS